MRGEDCKTNSLASKIRDFVSLSLNKKQKFLLLEAYKLDRKTTVTRFVNYVCKQHGFSKTTTWYNLKKLKSLGLVDFGTFFSRGSALTLTEFGKLVGGEENEY